MGLQVDAPRATRGLRTRLVVDRYLRSSANQRRVEMPVVGVGDVRVKAQARVQVRPRSTPRPRPPVKFVAVVTVLGTALGVLAAHLGSGAWANFIMVTLSGMCGVLAVEFARRRSDLPWWIPHVWSFSVLAIIVVPWALRLLMGSWDVSHIGSVDPMLPLTWRLHLLSSVSLLLGAVLFCLQRGRRAARTARLEAVHIPYPRMLIVLYGSGLYLHVYYEYVVGSAGWTAVLPLIALGAIAVVANPFARYALGRAPVARRAILFVGAAIVILELSRDFARYRVLIGALILAYALGRHLSQRRGLPAADSAAGRRGGRRGVAIAVIAIVVIVGVVGFVGIRGATRSNFEVGGLGLVLERAVLSLDVLGSTEAAFIAGATPGELTGRSYRELPVLLLPNSLVDDRAPRVAAADATIDAYLIETYGYSAPLWIETALNLPLGSAYIVLVLGAFFVTAALAVASRYWAVAAAGPAWVLVGYQALSRVSLFHAVLTVAFFSIGAWCGGRLLASFGGRAEERVRGNREAAFEVIGA